VQPDFFLNCDLGVTVSRDLKPAVHSMTDCCKSSPTW